MGGRHYFSISAFLVLITVIGAKSISNEIENYELADGVQYWPWGKDKNNFKCPSSFGAFADITDCSQFYLCVGGIASRRRCQRMQQFDKYKRICLPFIVAVCDKGDDTTTKAPRTTVGNEITTTAKDSFTCPSLLGSFMHPEDCSKYYSCTFFFPTLKTCPESELFDGVKKQCKPAKDVHCGTRQRPIEDTTEAETTLEITTIATTKEVETEKPTPAPTEPETTPTTTTKEEPTTTAKPRVTAPDTDCDEDDVDCIISDLGETPDWFDCPDDMGSYPHPSSKKLFIFCLNWKPSVKKCGQDLVFSEDLMTCVHPYLVKL